MMVRGGEGGLRHNGISSLHVVCARPARHGSETSLGIYVQNGSMMLPLVGPPCTSAMKPFGLLYTSDKRDLKLVLPEPVHSLSLEMD